MAENDKYGKPVVLPDGIRVAFDTSVGEWKRVDKIDPQNILKTNSLDTSYKKDDFQAATQVQSQGLYGTPSKDSTNVASTIPAAPASPMVDSTQTTTFTAPITNVENVVANTASAPGTTVTSDLTKTVQVGIEMNDPAQNVTENLLFPNNGN